VALEGECVAIPEFREGGLLPEGHWQTTWEEIEARFAGESGSRRAAIKETRLPKGVLEVEI
jgi:hypothetical protein